MIEEAYCSFEVSKLLKEKRFDGLCSTAYETITSKHNVEEVAISNWGKLNQIKRPTHQMAMAWLRDVHDIYIVFFHTNKSGWWYNITDMKDSYVFYSSEKTMCSYEEAVEAALKYSLKNLI